jgi:hypothetical protein
MALELICSTTRTDLTNRNAKFNADKIYMDINQMPTKEVGVSMGLKGRLISEYTKLKESFYPKEQSMIYSTIQSDNNLYDWEWIKENIKIATNPPFGGSVNAGING